MYHFAGYLIRNHAGDVVQYSHQRAQAEAFCQQNGLPPSCVVKIYEWKNIEPFVPTESSPQSDEPVDLQPSR